jgi:iron complex transport system ATP-binding protein
MLSIAGLTIMRGPCPVVERLSLEVAAGEIVAVIGPNGAGKSTALKGILGLLPSTGSVQVEGRPVAALGPRERAGLLGYVPQRSALVAAMSARNVVAQGRFAHQGLLARLSTADATAIEQALAAVDALPLAERPFPQLSLGEQQRILLARALASGARTILLDEPTAALDVGHALDLLALLRAQATAGRALLVVLHDLDQVARLADQVLLLDRGRTVVRGSPAEVLDARHLGPSFGVEPVAAGAMGFRRP